MIVLLSGLGYRTTLGSFDRLKSVRDTPLARDQERGAVMTMISGAMEPGLRLVSCAGYTLNGEQRFACRSWKKSCLGSG